MARPRFITPLAYPYKEIKGLGLEMSEFHMLPIAERMKSTPEVLEIMERAKMPLSSRRLLDDFSWNGKDLALYDHKGELRDNNCMLHELSHFLVATQIARRKPEFGCDTAPYIGSLQIDSSHYGSSMQQFYETRASMLGIFYERELGFCWPYTFCDHNWDILLDGQEQTPDGTTLPEVITWLYDHHHIDGDGRPTVRL
jgi:hypothetical protein